MLTAQEPTLDPRVEWMAEGLSAEYEVCGLGLYVDTAEATGPRCERPPNGRARVRVGRGHHDWVAVPDMAAEAAPGINELMCLYMLAELPAKVLERAVGALDASEEDLFRFRWLARYFLHTNSALIQAGRLIGGFDVVVAADLETLPAAVALGEEYGASLLYDAHEFWPHSIAEFRDWEIEFWSALERRLAPHADLRVTVSPQLADIMSREYGCEFLTLPNCAAKGSGVLVDVEAALRRQAARAEVDFLFLGGFAAGRGIEDLIAGWRHVEKPARLLLQGPDSPFKAEMMELARREGLLDSGVAFPPPVETADLVNAARQADVGIIPYAPSCLNNRYCSPNKLSQYMAAGLPILCNDTEFVKSVVVGNEIGICVDFRDHRALARAIDDLAASKQAIAEMSRRSQRLFQDKFNWEVASRDLYARLGEIVRRKPAQRRPDLDFSWIDEGREMRTRVDQLRGGPSIFSDGLEAMYTAEIAELERRYSDEIARLNEIYPAEIARLNDAYPAEIARLQHEIARYSWRNRVLRFPCAIGSGVAALKALAGDPWGRAALREYFMRRSGGPAFLVQLARVIAARNAALRSAAQGRPATLLFQLTGKTLEIVAANPRYPAASPAAAVLPDDLVAALAARRIDECALVFAPEIAPRARFISRDRYPLPELLAWLLARPARAHHLDLAISGARGTAALGPGAPSAETPRLPVAGACRCDTQR